MTKPAQKPGKLATLPEAARELGLDVDTLKKAANLGQLRSVEVGRRRYIVRRDLARLVGEVE